jgi:DNA mismatch repair protein MutS2
MITDETLSILEYDKVLAIVAAYAMSDCGKDSILSLRPLASKQEIEGRLALVEEIRNLTRLNAPLPLTPFSDIRPLLAQIRPQGALLDPVELALFIPPLSLMGGIARQFAYRTDIPGLKELAGHVIGFPPILDALEATIGPEGEILDSASRLLHELRSKKRALTARIRKRLEEIVRERQTAIFLQDDFITQRSGRWVIPVRMDSKGMVPGVVHDVSNSGETAFMEPIEIIGLANELENLMAEEKGEQLRILRELCAWLREEAEEIEHQFATLVQLDLLHSIACFAGKIDAEPPQINEESRLRLAGARHPLLVMQQAEGGPRVVPLDLSLGSSGETGGPERVMVITGPNAGGKTISLKTTGLLTLLALTGIPLPASGASTIPLVSGVLADIGDEQSIERSLSTFSGHVAKIARIVGKADQRALVLLDELGTGTDPLQGGAIACGILNDLQQHGAMVLATTHLTDIIGYVHRTPGMTNAAMEFDRTTFTPLYRLKGGEPGESHAIEIAGRFGMPERIIEFARGMLGRMDTEFHSLLAELKSERQRYEELNRELEERELAISRREGALTKALAEAEEGRRQAIAKALEDAKGIIGNARREMNAILDEARREKSRAAKEKLDKAEKELKAQIAQFRPEATLTIDDIQEGGTVFVGSIGYDAKVIAIDRRQGRVRVRAGQMELDVAASDLAPRQGQGAPAREKRQRKESGAQEETAREVNLIGMRVDEALPLVERLLNEASLEGIAEVRIVHGKGTGALMRGVREYLDGHPLVQGFRGGEPYEGGSGATVVTLR